MTVLHSVVPGDMGDVDNVGDTYNMDAIDDMDESEQLALLDCYVERFLVFLEGRDRAPC